MKLQSESPERVGMSSERLRNVASLAESWVADGVHRGIVALVSRAGRIVLHESFGRLTSEPNAPPMPLDAIFPLTSLSKPLSVAAALTLIEEGRLGPNRPVSQYIPEFAGEGKDEVRVDHLLTHTSGLTDEEVGANAEKKKAESVEVSTPDTNQHPNIHEHLFLGYDTPLSYPPGSEQRYCCYGIELVGELVRRISDQHLSEFARHKLFEPLGMDDTYYAVPETAAHRIAKRPTDAPMAWIDSREFQQIPWAYCGAYSTAVDMAIWGQMLLNGGCYGEARVFSPVTVKEMTRNQIPGIPARFVDEVFPEAATGYPWFICENKKVFAYGEMLQSAQAYCHGGAGGVFFWVDPAYELVGCFFSVDLAPITIANMRPYSCVDLFINAVTASIIEL